jgi:hypothetical protein
LNLWIWSSSDSAGQKFTDSLFLQDMYCALDSGDNEQNISIGANLRRKTRVNECKETKHSNIASGVGRKQTKIKSASYRKSVSEPGTR